MSYGDHIPLNRTDTQSSISTNATAPNLPGPGRNLGLLFDRGGKHVESLLNKFSKAHRSANETSQTSQTSQTGSEVQLSVSTNATAPNLPGPGRLVGLLLDGVGNRIESLLNKCANRIGMGPAHIAQEIRLLRGLRDLTIRELYSMHSSQLSEREKKKLKKRCNKLLKFAGSKLVSTQLVALDEVTGLAIEDSLIREIFSECRLEYLQPKYLEPNLFLTSAKALASIEEAATHELWSSVILRQNSDSKFEYNRKSIENSLFDPNTSFIAGRHLLNVVQCTTISVSFWLMSTYIQAASDAWLNIEWWNFSKCLCEFMRPDTTRERPSFAEFFRMFCPIPRIRSAAGYDTSDLEMNDMYDGVTDWNLDNCASFCVEFLTAFTGSEDIDEQLSFIQQMDVATRRLLEGTALFDDLCVAYCHLKHFSMYEFVDGSGVVRISDWLKLSPAAAILARSFDDATSPPRCTLARFLASHFCSLSRYCKMVSPFDESLNLLSFSHSTRLAERVKRFYVWEEGTSLFLNRSVRCLLRFVVDGVCHLVIEESFGLHKSEISQGGYKIIEKIFQRHFDQNITVDVLLYLYDELMHIRIGEADTFNSTYHYPLLAGYNEGGQALYCGRNNDYGDFTCVADGSSDAVFTDEFGKMWTSDEFWVMVLRYDPSDMITHRASSIGGSIDPTGPLHWRKLWPKEDSSLQSLMDERVYRKLTKRIFPLVERCIEDAEWQAILVEDFESDSLKTREQNGSDCQSTEILQCFRALPFSKNRAARVTRREEISDAEHNSYDLSSGERKDFESAMNAREKNTTRARGNRSSFVDTTSAIGTEEINKRTRPSPR
ncbi:hypothetical protein SCHPADRAFT_944117 [Schizopora paradoxa]|uniref:Uncharacterized protein n=1 Tax=Schizopora paradoxa TaxID=27342 RepID=A0A0H2RAG7_9AGAM|nr:hypothetical protein SCHPADRAFT_944117 [Schizopora paradoxa]